jgi:hypothetical protein
MADGEAIYDIFFRIKDNPLPTEITLDLPSLGRFCCNDFYLDYLADTASTDEFKNDVIGPLWWFSSVITAVEMKLWKDSGSGFVEVATLDDDTYGTYYEYGFFVNADDQNFVGYQLAWRNVLIAHGAGKYKIIATVSSELPFIVGSVETPIYCLSQYTQYNANGTVRLEYNISNIIGRSVNDEEIVDYGQLNWYNSYRVKGWFGFPQDELTETYVQYNTGRRVYVESEIEPEFVLQIKAIPQFLHDILRVDFMQSDVRQITDYNAINTNNYIQKRVIPNSGYKPNWRVMKNKLAPVELKFRQEFNNLKKLRC